MSKLRLTTLLLLVAALGLPARSSARPEPVQIDSAVAPVRTAAANLTSHSEEILATVAKLRGLPVLHPVPSGLKTRREIEGVVLKNLKESTTREELADSTLLLRFLGLVPQDFDLEKSTTSLLTEQIAGFYDPKTKFFYLADWIPLGEQRTVIAHELTHALADQHFDLGRFEKWPEGDSDAELAAHALVEGEATALMIEFTLAERNAPHDLGALPISLMDLLRGSLDENDPDHPVLSGAPGVLRESLQFPYLYGLGFVQDLLRNGSWKNVTAAYKRLPASTEQVIHPEKYVLDERPVAVGLPDVAASLGPGWKRADADTNGEFGYFLLMRETLGNERAAEAAAGWAGDRYGFYINGDRSAVTLVHGSVWDSEAEAEQFVEAYRDRVLKRFPGSAGTSRTAAVISWKTTEGAVLIERRGKRVVIVEGYRGANPAAIIASVWKSQGLAGPA